MGKGRADPPAHLPVLDIMCNAFVAQALRVVAERNIADLLAERPATSAELAQRLELNPRALNQVLRSLTSLGVFTSDSDGQLNLTALGETLRVGHASAARDLVLTIAGPMSWPAMARMNEAVATGRSGTELEFDRSAFQMLRDAPEQAGHFDRMMLAFHGAEPAAVAEAYDFSTVTSLVDVGGGIGTMLRTVLLQHAHLTGTLFDQPGVIEHARRQPLDPRLTGRFELAAGSFFEFAPPGADAYLLSHIVHDWSDTDCARILSTCRAAMTRSSRLLIVEMVLPDGDEPHPGKLLDLIMMSILGGQERTGEQYRELLAASGLTLVSITPTNTPVSVLEATLAG